MRLFHRDHNDLTALSALELTILGCASGLASLLLTCLIAAAGGRPCWQAVSEWDALRWALGAAVGVPVFGIIASNRLGLGLPGQIVSTASAISGGGPLLVLAAEYGVRYLLRVLGS